MTAMMGWLPSMTWWARRWARSRGTRWRAIRRVRLAAITASVNGW